MPNHPNRRAVYRIDIGGTSTYVATRRAALAEACRLSGAPTGTDERTLSERHGVTLTRVSAALARAEGLL